MLVTSNLIKKDNELFILIMFMITENVILFFLQNIAYLAHIFVPMFANAPGKHEEDPKMFLE